MMASVERCGTKRQAVSNSFRHLTFGYSFGYSSITNDKMAVLL
ncbi:MAG: hypothetical protein WBI44_01990 [Syntrophaceticus sp.]